MAIYGGPFDEIRPLQPGAAQTVSPAGARAARQAAAPLLRGLLDSGLVHRDESGGWELTDTAKRRLDVYADQAEGGTDTAVLGRHCQRCGSSGLTWDTEGTRLCRHCRDAGPDFTATSQPAPDVGERRRGRWLHRAS